MVRAQITSVQENETFKILWDFKIQAINIIQNQSADLILISKKERICPFVDFLISTDLIVKLNERGKFDEIK